MAKEAIVTEAKPVGAAQNTDNVTTLTNIISQAVQSGDQQLLETALSVTDAAVIEATLQKLPAPQVAPFLTQLLDRVEKKPGRLHHLLPWIRGCMSVHATTLMAGGESSLPVLERASAMMQKRLEMHQPLLKLAGRLDLLLMQIVRRGDSQEAQKLATLVHKPVAVFQADDDSEGDEVQNGQLSSSSSEDDESTDVSEDIDDQMSVDEE